MSSEAQALVLGGVAIPWARTCPLLPEPLTRLSVTRPTVLFDGTGAWTR